MKCSTNFPKTKKMQAKCNQGITRLKDISNCQDVFFVPLSFFERIPYPSLVYLEKQKIDFK